MKKIFLACFIIPLLGIGVSKAQITNLYGWATPANPYGSLTISGNVMYGATVYGGTLDEGSVFSINKDGSNYKTLWSFEDTGVAFNASGSGPEGNLTLIGNRLYGTTFVGGANANGQIFSIRIDGSGFRDLWDFADTGSLGNQNGSEPGGSVVLIGNKLFGYTSASHVGNGILFSIDTLGHGFKDLHDFNGGTSGSQPNLGALAVSPSGQILYGVTNFGGLNSQGMVYAVDTGGMNFKDLHDFAAPGGQGPYSSVILWGTKLFGMTYDGGPSSDGTIFTVDTAGHNFKNLLNFIGSNGVNPFGDFIVVQNKLYGMAYLGGANNYGLIFSIDSDGTAYDDLADFNGTNGKYPYGYLSLSGNKFYGMTSDGGTGDGNIFGWADTTIHTGLTTTSRGANKIIAYPNPGNGNFTFQIINGEASELGDEILVYNVLGKQIYSSVIDDASKATIDISSNPNGIYLYRVLTENGNLLSEGKLILQK